MYAGMVVIANILASKIVQFGPFSVPAAVLVYASTFLLTDMLTEFYGKKEANKAIWSGLLANIMLVVSVWIAIEWQSAPFWTSQDAFASVLGNTPRIVLASLIAYIISQTHDVRAYEYWKKKTKGKHLWLRNNASTIASQLLDTVIFITIAFYGVMPLKDLIIGQYAVKLLIALLDTPYLYAVRGYYARK